MPLLRGKRNRKANFREFGKGKAFRRTKKKYGAKRANKKAVEDHAKAAKEQEQITEKRDTLRRRTLELRPRWAG